MRFLIPLSIVLLTAAVVYADPYLTCDPQTGVTKYKLVIDTVESLSDALADGAAWHDLINIAPGNHNANLYAGKNWTIDGIPQETINWSDPRPFVLGRPNVSQSPTGITLKDNH